MDAGNDGAVGVAGGGDEAAAATAQLMQAYQEMADEVLRAGSLWKLAEQHHQGTTAAMHAIQLLGDSLELFRKAGYLVYVPRTGVDFSRMSSISTIWPPSSAGWTIAMVLLKNSGQPRQIEVSVQRVDEVRRARSPVDFRWPLIWRVRGYTLSSDAEHHKRGAVLDWCDDEVGYSDLRRAVLFAFAALTTTEECLH